MKYKISVIMGIYNCESTLDEAINSLLNQTYSYWKLIICDDCSTDDSYKIAEKYVKKYKNMVLIQNEKNMGLNYTLNHCLKYVDTEYTARMDGDDISLPTRFEKEIIFLEKNKEYSIVSSSMIHFDEYGEWGEEKLIAYPQKEDFIKRTPFCHAPSMVRSEAYLKVDGYTVKKSLLRVEDYHLWYKMYLNGFKGHNIDESLYKMRDGREAISRRKYRYRINEAYVKFLIMKDFQLSFINLVYVIKPLIVGLLPNSIYKVLHRTKIRKRGNIE